MALLRWARTAVPTATGAPVFAVVDVETTGLSPSHHRILELAVIRTDAAGRVVDEWTSRFNPEGPVGATHIHGITDADVANAPLFSATASDVAARMAGCCRWHTTPASTWRFCARSIAVLGGRCHGCRRCARWRRAISICRNWLDVD